GSGPGFDRMDAGCGEGAHAGGRLLAAYLFLAHRRVGGVAPPVAAGGEALVGGSVDDLAAGRARALLALDRDVALFGGQLGLRALKVRVMLGADALAGLTLGSLALTLRARLVGLELHRALAALAG